MRLILPAAAASLCALALCAQDAPDPSKPTILVQGVVRDEQTREPIAGAVVQIISMSAAGDPSQASGARSGPAGDFQVRVRPGERLVVAGQADHYQPANTTVKVIATQETVLAEVLLSRLQGIQGVLVDDASRKPVEGLAVEIVQAQSQVISLMPGQRTKTLSAADGRFAFAELPQGEYFLRISGKPAVSIEEIPAKDLEGDGRDKALQPPDGAASFGTIVWPGQTADIPSTPGIKLGAASVDLGEIRLTRGKLTNLMGLAGPCEEGASIQVMVSRPQVVAALGLLATRDLPCGSGFRLMNLPDGSFTVTTLQGFPQRRWGTQTIDARARSPLRLTLNAFVSVEISVEGDVEDGKPADLPEGLRVNLSSDNPAIKVDQPAVLRPQSFEATLYPGEQYHFSVQAGPKYYVKRATYNAAGIPDLSAGFTASTAGLSQLNLVVSDRAASIQIQVGERGKSPLTRPSVFLVRDGMSFDEFHRDFLRIPVLTGDALTFGSLAPGTYRAVGPNADGVLPTTESLFQAMLKDSSRQSMPVTVDEGQTATITWDAP